MIKKKKTFQRLLMGFLDNPFVKKEDRDPMAFRVVKDSFFIYIYDRNFNINSYTRIF
jgi:hypothetical protein